MAARVGLRGVGKVWVMHAGLRRLARVGGLRSLCMRRRRRRNHLRWSWRYRYICYWKSMKMNRVSGGFVHCGDSVEIIT